MRVLMVCAALFAASSCTCRGDTLIRTDDDQPVDAGAGGGIGHVGGTGGGGFVGGVGGGMMNPMSWCGSDCDCPTGTRCVNATSELSGNECQPGTNTCTVPCSPGCGAGQQCVGGQCTVPPCVGTNCVSGFPVSVAGTYKTNYELDISRFAQNAAEILKVIDLLQAAISGQANCTTQSTPEGRLMCIIVQLIAENIQPPAWVSQLLDVFSGMFKFGNKPVLAKGVMQLAESPDGRVNAAETWSEMWLEYNGQVVNVMNSPMLGTNGQVTVTVKAFGGTRDGSNVYLGPRDVEFDVNKLLVNVINIGITAASQNRAHDIGELIELILCDQIPITSANYLVCTTAAGQLASQFELPIGLGGVHITDQRARIIDADGNGIADSLGTAAARGIVNGEMSNGLTSGQLGAFPSSNWYGIK